MKEKLKKLEKYEAEERNSEFMIYPVYHREGYGWQQDNPEGTDGVVQYYTMYEEFDHGGEGAEIIAFGPTMIDEMSAIVRYLNEREGEE